MLKSTMPYVIMFEANNRSKKGLESLKERKIEEGRKKVILLALKFRPI